MQEFFKTLKEISIKISQALPYTIHYPTVSKIGLTLFLIFVLFINVKTFILFSKDKSYAIHDLERISEGRLLKYCFWGGALGGLLGMYIIRHKTQKALFKILVPLMFITQLMIFGVFIGFFGFWVYPH